MVYCILDVVSYFEKAYEYTFLGVVKGIYYYSFISKGEYIIVKQVSFKPLQSLNIYNLGFENVEVGIEGSSIVNDKSEINNTDFDKVLSTVFMCLIDFLENNEHTLVLFFGNTWHKQEIYLRKISAHINELKSSLKIYGGSLSCKVKFFKRLNKNNKIILEKRIDSSIFNHMNVKNIEVFDPKNKRKYDFVIIGFKLGN